MNDQQNIKDMKENDQRIAKDRGQENVPPIYQAPHYRFKLNNGNTITIPVEVYTLERTE